MVIATNDPAHRAACRALRHRVFCEEQGVPPALERDGRDEACVHLAALDQAGAVVGTCRLLPGAPGAARRLGRMAVAPEARGRGVAGALLGAAHAHAAAAGATRMELSAQAPVIRVYAGAGYRTHGGVYEEAGIPHVRMSRPLAEGGLSPPGPPAPNP